jgi:hypothetical protein
MNDTMKTPREILLEVCPQIQKDAKQWDRYTGYNKELERIVIVAMERYAKQKLNIHGVVRPASASVLEGEPLPAEGKAKSVRVGCLICGVEINADDICFNCALNGYYRA